MSEFVQATDLACCKRLVLWPQLNSQAVADYQKECQVKVPGITQWLLRQFGLLHEAALAQKITEPSLAKSFQMKRVVIIETFGHLSNKTFATYIKEVNLALGNGGPEFNEIWAKRLQLVRHLPMPYEQTFPITMDPNAALKPDNIQSYKTTQQGYVARLFQEVDGEADDGKGCSQAPVDIQYIQFITSKAGLVQEGVFVSWFELLFQWRMYNPSKKDQVDGLLTATGCMGYLHVQKRPSDKQLPPDLPFRGYVVERSIDAMEGHVNLKFFPKCRAMLRHLCLRNDQARRQLNLSTSQKNFATNEHVPNNTEAEPFMKMLAPFCRFRNDFQVAMPNEKWETLFDWLVEGGIVYSFDFPVDNLEAVFDWTVTFCQEAHISPHRWFYSFRSLAKMQHRDAFGAFLRQAQQEGIPLMQDGVISFMFERGIDHEDYAPCLTRLRSVQTVLNTYAVQKPPSAKFWADIIHLQGDVIAKAEEFGKAFRTDEHLTDDFYVLFYRYLQGKICIEDFQLLERFAKLMHIQISASVICSIIAHVYNRVEHPVADEAFLQVIQILQFVWNKYHASILQIGRLLFELLTVPPQVGIKQLSFIAAIEDFVGFPLHSNDVHFWLMHHPSLGATTAFLRTCSRVRKTIVTQHLDDFALPTPLLTEHHENLAELPLLPSEGAKPGRHEYTEFHQISASIGVGLIYSILSNSFQPISDFIHVDAAKDLPFDCGEESRTSIAAQTLCLLNPKYPMGKAIWRGWEIPANPLNFPIFTVYIVNLQTMRSYRIRASLELSWQALEQDPTLFDMLHDISKHLGEENHEHVEALPQGDALDSWLPLFPQCTKWADYQPQALNKQTVGATFFRFIKLVKVSFRRGLIELATSSLPDALDLLNDRLTGHVYPSGTSLSLIPPNAPMLDVDRARFTVGLEFKEVCEKLKTAILGFCEDAYGGFVAGINDLMQLKFQQTFNGFCSDFANDLASVCEPVPDNFIDVMTKLISHEFGNKYKEFCERIIREVRFLTRREDEAFGQMVEKVVKDCLGEPGADYDSTCEAIQKRREGTNRQTRQITQQLPPSCFYQTLQLKCCLFLFTREKSSALNEVTLSIGNVSHTIRYGRLLYADNFSEILRWHILLLFQKVHQNG